MHNNRKQIHNDEPSNEDTLDREQFAEAFARLAEICNTPLIIGLYGSWGIGKTTLMTHIKNKLDTQKTCSVWFDPWQYQFDNNIVLALLHTLVETLGLKEEGKKLLMIIAGAFSSLFLKVTTTLNFDDIDKIGKRYEEEHFQVRESRILLREYFKKLIEKARGEQNRRIVFFIDDLDRCMPSNTLKVLESLKLYLNFPGCVYFLGVDRHSLESSIKHHYKDIKFSENSYLDKIIQLPFNIPPIASDSMEKFISPLLSDDLIPLKSLLMNGLSNNPREVKRFINTLSLNHLLASKLSIPEYDPKILALLQLIQFRNAILYNIIIREPALLLKLNKIDDKTRPIFDDYLKQGDQLRNVLLNENLNVPDNIKLLKQYIYLTQISGLKEEPPISEPKIDIREVLIDHKEYIKASGKKGNVADLRGIDLKGVDFCGFNIEDIDLTGAILTHADMSGANLSGITMRRTYLRGSNLTKANLKGVDISEADLTNTSLIGANLSGANLRRSNLFEANLLEADLSGADLSNTNLTNVRGLTAKQINEAIINEMTILPDYIRRS